MTATTQPQMPFPVATPQAMPTPQAPMPAQAMPTPQAPMPPQAMPMPTPQAPMPAQAMPTPQAPMPQGMPMQQPPAMIPNQHAAMPPMQVAQTAPVGASNLPLGQAENITSREGGEKVLPQISIHAFCDRQETAHCMNETTRDWRMKRTNVKIYMGGLPSAIEFYHKENTPNLIMIESGMNGAELFAQLEVLASVCDEGTKVVIIGAANDIRLYRQLMDKGVSDYIVPPLHPLNLIRAMGELYADPENPFIGRAVAFFGAKGGVGSSTIAHNIAWCLSENIMQETALI
ncbi:MAG: pilus assembly protein CpaE, partial [Litorimonas sp.]